MCLLYVMDVNDMKGGYADDIVRRINEKYLDYLIIINKIDTLPQQVSPNSLRSQIIAKLNDNEEKFNDLVK